MPRAAGVLLLLVVATAAGDLEPPVISLDLGVYNPSMLTEVEFSKEKAEVCHAREQVRHCVHPASRCARCRPPVPPAPPAPAYYTVADNCTPSPPLRLFDAVGGALRFV